MESCGNPTRRDFLRRPQNETKDLRRSPIASYAEMVVGDGTVFGADGANVVSATFDSFQDSKIVAATGSGATSAARAPALAGTHGVLTAARSEDFELFKQARIPPCPTKSWQV